MSLFTELRNDIQKTTNANFHFEALDWVTRVWIKHLCNLIDKKQAKGLDDGIWSSLINELKEKDEGYETLIL